MDWYSDFFVSYVSQDRAWGDWITYVLNQKGGYTVLPLEDSADHPHFTLGVTKSRRIMPILSPASLDSSEARLWQSLCAMDPKGIARKIIPVVAVQCQFPDPLGSIVPIELTAPFESDDHAAAFKPS